MRTKCQLILLKASVMWVEEVPSHSILSISECVTVAQLHCEGILIDIFASVEITGMYLQLNEALLICYISMLYVRSLFVQKA